MNGCLATASSKVSTSRVSTASPSAFAASSARADSARARASSSEIQAAEELDAMAGGAAEVRVGSDFLLLRGRDGTGRGAGEYGPGGGFKRGADHARRVHRDHAGTVTDARVPPLAGLLDAGVTRYLQAAFADKPLRLPLMTLDLSRH
jgi:hypothetical protein